MESLKTSYGFQDDSDVPLLNIEEYTANDPALKKIRETQKLLLRKREEMLKQENEAKIQGPLNLQT